LGKLLPKEEEEIGRCSLPASFLGVLRRCSGDVELQWQGRRKGSSSMAKLEREVFGESGREREGWEKTPR